MPDFFKMFMRVIARLILCGTTALMTVFAVGVYAQALPVAVPAQTLADSHKLEALDYCREFARLLHPKDKIPGPQTLDLAVKACEVYVQIEAMYCLEIKDKPLEVMVSKLKESPHNYSLDEALKDLESLLQTLDREGCKTKPVPVHSPDPFGKR